MRAWPRLRGWLEEDREGQRLWRHLAVAAAEWDRLGRRTASSTPASARGAARVGRAHDAQPTPAGAGVPRRVGRTMPTPSGASLEQQARHERRQNRRLRGLLVGVALALVGALVAGLLAVRPGPVRSRPAGLGARLPRAGPSRGAGQQVPDAAGDEPRGGRAARRRGVAGPRGRAGRVGAARAPSPSAPGFLGTRSMPYPDSAGGHHPRHDADAILASGNRMHVVDLDTGRAGARVRRTHSPTTRTCRCCG